MKATRGRIRPSNAGADGVDAALYVGDQRFAGLPRIEPAGNAADVSADVGGRVGLQRDDIDRPAGPGAGGGLYVAEADRAHLAVVLRDDHVGRQLLQRLAVDPIDGKALAHNRLHTGVDLGARALHPEFGRGKRRQRGDVGREVALVAAPHEPIAAAERADDLGGAGNQADDALLGLHDRLG
jgi:hypothetical protein